MVQSIPAVFRGQWPDWPEFVPVESVPAHLQAPLEYRHRLGQQVLACHQAFCCRARGMTWLSIEAAPVPAIKLADT